MTKLIFVFLMLVCTSNCSWLKMAKFLKSVAKTGLGKSCSVGGSKYILFKNPLQSFMNKENTTILMNNRYIAVDIDDMLQFLGDILSGYETVLEKIEKQKKMLVDNEVDVDNQTFEPRDLPEPDTMPIVSNVKFDGFNDFDCGEEILKQCIICGTPFLFPYFCKEVCDAITQANIDGICVVPVQYWLMNNDLASDFLENTEDVDEEFENDDRHQLIVI